jgi:SAM-dependent methyltransferase
MSEDYWRAKSATDEFEKYWNTQNKDSLKRRWGIVQSLQLEPPKSLLDVGCGIGNLITFTPLATVENYLGIDISEPMITRAKVLHPGYTFRVMDPMELPKHPVEEVVIAHGFLLHQHDLFLKLDRIKAVAKNCLIIDVLVAKEGYSRRSPQGYWTRVLGEEEYGFMKKNLGKEFTLKEVVYGRWAGNTEYYLSCRRI